MTMDRAKMGITDPADGPVTNPQKKEFHARRVRAKGKSGKGRVKTPHRRGGRRG